MDRSLLVSEFDDMGLSISDDIIDECVITCHTHKISASDFVGSWIAHCASSQTDANDLNKEKITVLVKSFEIDSGHKTSYKTSTENTSNLDESVSLQPVNSPVSLESTSLTNDKKIDDEISVSAIVDGDNNTTKEENTSSTTGDVACHFGLENVNKSDSSTDVETLSVSKQKLWSSFIFGRVNYQKFEIHIKKIVNDIVENNNLNPVTPLAELYYGNDDTEITISGRLKLRKKELYLTSTHGYIKLDLSEAEQPTKSLFANQILVATGTNPGTKVFIVRKLYTDASLPLSKNLPTFSQGNVNMVVAAGPFFSLSSPEGKSLKSLVQKTMELEAKLLVLLGPIFEADFGTQLNKISVESIQKCYDDVLEAVLKPLFSNESTQNTKLVVFSSWKDAVSYAFYPTPPITESNLPNLYPNNIFMVSDPCVFTANDIIIAGNASDTLMDIHVSAINQTQEEMFAKLTKNIVWQRCLHPSYTASPTVPVDQVLWLKHCTFEENTPHIILTSSQLRSFIRVFEGCMVINVGQLVKYNSQKQAVSGTYGKIQIAPPKNGHWSPETNISAEVLYI